jgi:penicillin-binding protein 1A
MNTFLVQILAMGLTVSQLISKPVEQFITEFDPQAGIPAATQLLKGSCSILTKQIDDPRFNIEVILNAMAADAKLRQKEASKKPALQSEPDKLLKRVDFNGLSNAYKFLCKGETAAGAKINWSEVLRFYNRVFKDLRDVQVLKNYKFTPAALVLDRQSQPITETTASVPRRIFVPIGKIPLHVRQAFISAEDQNFYAHKGIDPNGLARAFMSVAGGSSDRPQGGSTITQQVVKNLLLNNELSVERKMREMLLASRLEKILTKDQILELYLNLIYLGRSSWGVESATRNYFGVNSTVGKLTPEQAALLAGLTKGPNYYSPDRHPERAVSRRQYVLNRMREDCMARKKEACLTPQQISAIANKPLQLAKFEKPTIRGGLFYQDASLKEARQLLGENSSTESQLTIYTTINQSLQKATDQALRDGLTEYEQMTGRRVWKGPLASIADEIETQKLQWKDVLARVQPRLYDVPWTLGVILDIANPQVGLLNGKILPLRAPPAIGKRLKKYDVVFIDVTEKWAVLKIPPQVQGAAIVLENQTGRVLALTGGFSYGASEYNRAIQAQRQPGSTLKPFIYLSALNMGIQPNTLLPDMPHDPPLDRNWRPRNYDLQTRGLVTIRTAIENSLNLPTVQLTARLGGSDPYYGLKTVQKTLMDVGLYNSDFQTSDFATVLGSRELTLLGLATAYATVANTGLRPTPYFVDTIVRAGRTIHSGKRTPLARVEGVDRVSFFQLRRILEGTVARGTAVRLKQFQGLIGGKTGTSNNETDAWFVCFTNDLTIAAWVGYDNKSIHANLGEGSTGGSVALPIVEKILKASFPSYRVPQKLSGPPGEISKDILEAPIEMSSGEFGRGNFPEIFRLDRSTGKPIDTIRILLKPEESGLGIAPKPVPEEDAARSGTRPATLPKKEPYIDIEEEFR